jgi:hypothetical protein
MGAGRRSALGAALLGLTLLAATIPALGAAPGHLPQKVTGPQISMLIRTTVVALDQANLTANYSVLRDLGDTHFQATYSQSALSDMFRGFRDRGINLAPVVLYDAQLDAPPKLTTDGLLRVVGHFSTTPDQVVFDITFRVQGGIWRLDAVNAGTRPAPVSAVGREAPPASADAPLPAGVPVPVLEPAASRAPVPLARLRRQAPLVQEAPLPLGTVDTGSGETGFE